MDAQVFDAGLKAGLEIPDGYYYLADVGYSPKCKLLLSPYCGVQYHLAEWSRASLK